MATATPGFSRKAPTLFNRLPLGLYWFKDGIYVISAPESTAVCWAENSEASNYGRGAGLSPLTPLVAHENDAELRLTTPGTLLIPELLFASLITDSPESVHLEVTSSTGQGVSADGRPLAVGEAPQRVSAFTGQPLYTARTAWSPIGSRPSTMALPSIFIQSVRQRPKQPFREFQANLREMLSREGVKRLIVDLRYNGGGNSAILDPWSAEIKGSRFNARGKLFVVVGRSAFPSAILNALRFRNTTSAILVGEPTAGKPNHFGEVKTFELPNSHIQVSYSTKYFRDSKQDTDSLIPDILAEPDFPRLPGWY